MGILSAKKHKKKKFLQNIKDTYWKAKLRLPKGTIPQLVIAAVIVVSLPLAVYFSLRPANFTPRADVEPVEIFFTPDTQNMPPDSTFKIFFDSKSQPISFVRMVMTYDVTKLQLTSDITTSQLNTVVKKTNMATANSTGRAEIVLGLTPGDPTPTGIFEIAEFSMTSLSSNENDPAVILLDNADIQIVDSSAQALSGNITPANLTLNYVAPTETPTTTPTLTPSPTLIPTADDPQATDSATLTPTQPPPTETPTTAPPTVTPTLTPFPTIAFGPSVTVTVSPTPTNPPITEDMSGDSLATVTPTPTTAPSGGGGGGGGSSSGGSSGGGGSSSTGSSDRKRGDANGDGKVNILDLSRVLSRFGKGATSDSDLNGDGKVNILDLSIILSQWGK